MREEGMKDRGEVKQREELKRNREKEENVSGGASWQIRSRLLWSSIIVFSFSYSKFLLVFTVFLLSSVLVIFCSCCSSLF